MKSKGANTCFDLSNQHLSLQETNILHQFFLTGNILHLFIKRNAIYIGQASAFHPPKLMWRDSPITFGG
jgi:hypothetical protein